MSDTTGSASDHVENFETLRPRSGVPSFGGVFSSRSGATVLVLGPGGMRKKGRGSVEQFSSVKTVPGWQP